MKKKIKMIFKSVDDFKKAYFPISYAAEKDENTSAHNLGTKLARESLEKIKSKLPIAND